MTITYLVHIDGTEGEDHNYFPSSGVNAKYSKTYICLKYIFPRISNTRTIQDEKNVVAGIPFSEQGTFIFNSHPLLVRIMNFIRDGATIKCICVIQVGQSAVEGKRIALSTHLYSQVFIEYIGFWSTESPMIIGGISTNSTYIARFKYKTCTVEYKQYTAEGSTDTIKAGISNAHAIAKAGK
ncbi:hypothetical protein IOLA_239 [uncultured bacterium]|nr:hypothetical protein IOLA_239 [uncultured bacterium]